MTQVYKPQVLQFESSDLMYTEVKNVLSDIILDSISETGTARLALSGGQTPLPIYQKLSNDSLIPWDQVELFQVDERFVQPNSDLSNQYNLTHALTRPVLDVCKEVNFFKTDVEIPQAVIDYTQKIIALDDPYFDVVVLGVGNDGHIASLFPGGDYFNSSDAVLSTIAPEHMVGGVRLTLSLETILNAQTIIVVLAGENKKDIVLELLEGKKRAVDFPAKFLLAHPKLYIYECFES